jgi:biopolymer transport protein ExbB
MSIDINIIKDNIDFAIVAILLFLNFLVVWFWIERVLFFRNIDIYSYETKEELEIDLTKNITIISTIASNAPYIGLLGTVIGIIITFYLIGLNGNLDTKIIISSLALALKATALGLIVAIVAIFFNNHLVRKIEVLLTKWEVAKKKGEI